MDAFAERAKTKRRLHRTRRKNLRRREESKRSAREDARLRSGVYEAFARESAVEQGLDPSVWPFIPLSAEAAAQMGREYALIHSVERNHRLRRAPPRAPPPAEPPDRPGRRVRFADPLVTEASTGQLDSVLAQAQGGAGCHTSSLSRPVAEASPQGCSNWQERRESAAEASPQGCSSRIPTRTPRDPGLAERRLPAQAAPREWRKAPGWLDPLSFPAAAARRPREAADSVSLDPEK